MSKIKVLIVDENARFRQRVANLLKNETIVEIVGELDDGLHVVREVVKSSPDFVIMDVSMPGMNGLDAMRQLVDTVPDIKVLMVSIYDIHEYKEMAISYGARGYLVKKDIVSKLIPAFRAILNNDVYMG